MYLSTSAFIILVLTIHVNLQSTILNSKENANHETLGIIHGQDVPEGKYPFMVSLQIGDTPCDSSQPPGAHACGGTIINDNTILTGAFCLNHGPSKIAIVANKTNWDREGFCYKVSKVFQHSGEDSRIGIVKLATPIDFEKLGDKVASPVCLAPLRAYPVNTKCKVMGWGYIEGLKNSNQMREKTVSVEKRTNGTADDEGVRYEVDEPTSCYGDAGGALLCPVEGDEDTLLQFGIAAYFLSNDAPSVNCSGGGTSFVNVAPYIPWIKKLSDE